MTGLVRDFLPALLDPDLPVPDGLQDTAGRPAGCRFNVYRNNVAASLAQALEQGFPAIAKLLGDQNFQAIAAAYLRVHPPSSPLMMQYGTDFPAFLAGFPPLAHLGYLADVARLELALRQSYHAADSTPVAPEAIAAIPPETLLQTRLSLSPATLLIRSPWPLHAIWAFNRIEGSPVPEAMAQDVLITRADYDPAPHPLPSGGGAFIAALMAGQSLGAAHDAGVSDAGDFDPTPCLTVLLAGQAITGIETPTP